MGIMYTGGMKNKPEFAEFEQSDLSFSVLQVSRMFRVSPQAVYGWIKSGRLEKYGDVVPARSILDLVESESLAQVERVVMLEKVVEQIAAEAQEGKKCLDMPRE